MLRAISKVQSHRELNDPRTLGGAEDQPERSAVHIGVGIPSAGAVENVEKVSASLEIHPLSQRLLFQNPEVFALGTGTSDFRQEPRRRAELCCEAVIRGERRVDERGWV